MSIKNDNYFCTLIAYSFLFDLVAMILLMLIAPFGLGIGMIGICGVGVLLYALFLIIDVYWIFKANRYGITHEDYILAAMVIYLDIINLFLEILRLLGSLSDKSN